MFLALFLFRIEHNPPVREHVDSIELNHVHNPDGSVRLSQYVYSRFKRTWGPNAITGEREYKAGFEVVDWRLSKGIKIPVKNWIINKYKQSFYDEKSSCFREITTSCFIETHTYYDVELEARKYINSDSRQLLKKPMRISLDEEN